MKVPESKRAISRDGSNWTSIIAAVAAFGVLFGVDISGEQQAQLVTGIVTAQTVVNGVIRKYRTGA